MPTSPPQGHKLRSADAAIAACHQLRGFRLADDARLRVVRVLGDLLEHLDQSVRDRHAWETLLAAVRAGVRVAA